MGVGLRAAGRPPVRGPPRAGGWRVPGYPSGTASPAVRGLQDTGHRQNLALPHDLPHAGTRPFRLVRILFVIMMITWSVAGVGYLSVRHYFWPRIDTWRPQIVEQASALLGRPLVIGRIESGFEGLLPRLTMRDVVLRDDG
ncbi:MAG: hypothetical protein RIS35_204, partial [Pseudomonadota bacterium]